LGIDRHPHPRREGRVIEVVKFHGAECPPAAPTAKARKRRAAPAAGGWRRRGTVLSWAPGRLPRSAAMIELRDLCYVRLGTRDLGAAERFATEIVGLQAIRRSPERLYLRSSYRDHTLCYFA